MGFHGARYIQINVPCPLGWGAASHDTIKLARLAIETGLFPIFEAENGRITHVRKIRRKTPVDRISEAAAPLRASLQRRRTRIRALRACRRSPTAISRTTACWRRAA